MYIICVSFPLRLLLLFSSHVSVHMIVRPNPPPLPPNQIDLIPFQLTRFQWSLYNRIQTIPHICIHVTMSVSVWGSSKAMHVRPIESYHLAISVSTYDDTGDVSEMHPGCLKWTPAIHSIQQIQGGGVTWFRAKKKKKGEKKKFKINILKQTSRTLDDELVLAADEMSSVAPAHRTSVPLSWFRL